jgi:adenylate cyclase
MAVEIERKFLLISDNWRAQVTSSSQLTQGYLHNSAKSSIRVRIDNDRADINIKTGKISVERQEFEYSVPVSEAREMLLHLVDGPLIEKTRHHVMHNGHHWDIDEFHGDNRGLVVAEIELETIDEAFDLPDWAGQEVSDDPRYYNVNLILHPYKDW